jgi:hypothetical protein
MEEDQETEPDGLTINFTDGSPLNIVFFIMSIIIFGINIFIGK